VLPKEEGSLPEKEPENETSVKPELDLETADAEVLKRALLEEKDQVERYLANWQRAQADFTNFKRRTEQERGELIKFANTAFVINLLPVIDDLERALEAVSTKLAGISWVDGIRLIYRKLMAVLEAQGVSEIEALGQDFDPNLHDAVMYGEGEEGKVVEELQKGYKLHERVIRPSMVKVGRREAATKSSDEES